MAAEETTPKPTQAPESAPERKPYRAPSLRRLGSVRELTLGALMSPVPDAVVGFMAAM